MEAFNHETIDYDEVTKFIKEKLKFSKLLRFFNPNKVTAPRVGIESKKDILAESNLWNFNNLAAVIVIPDLLTPGIKDRTWKNPIKTADL